MKVKSESEVAQSRPTLCDPMDCSLPVFSVHGIFQARILEEKKKKRKKKKNTGMGCHFLLQERFPTQGLKPGLPHCRQTLYRLSHQNHNGDPVKLFVGWVGGWLKERDMI